ncbi:ribokinase [Corynebacterium endometrii]|uniref:Ribokinase n=1 Tax=Corynebacterium endometrii TaxID=2488819 RepID=A0A4P7QGD2_9CORY|nr:ribokinase [Corynebacterium endometrii]QCB27834.1 Ribokinase [Corynebacterium endometrii]
MGITVVGSINADLIARVARHPSPGETLSGEGGEISAGGKGANQAVAAALLGAEVSFVGAVGDDPYAEPALEYLRASGVDLSAVKRAANTQTGLAVITVAEDGENTIVVIPGANGLVTRDYVRDHRGKVSGADIVLLQGEVPASGFAEAVSLASGRVVINLAPVVEVPRDALLRADPLVANEHEAGLILEQLGAGAESGEPHAIAEALLKAGFASVVLTLGAKGAVVADAEGLRDVATPRVSAVDTTGAGDAFAGALCSRLLAGDGLDAAAQFAARVGAHATLASGAQPSYADMDTQLPAC